MTTTFLRFVITLALKHYAIIALLFQLVYCKFEKTATDVIKNSPVKEVE